MLLIHDPVGQRATRSEAEGRAVHERAALGEDLRSRGLLLGAESLESTDHAALLIFFGNKAVIIRLRAPDKTVRARDPAYRRTGEDSTPVRQAGATQQ